MIYQQQLIQKSNIHNTLCFHLCLFFIQIKSKSFFFCQQSNQSINEQIKDQYFKQITKQQIITQLKITDMITSYIANLQIRLQMIENCIGQVSQYKQEGIKQVKSKSTQFISKLHKDTQRKFEKIKKVIEKYGHILDIPTTPKEKLQIVYEDLQQLKEVASHLDKIQKLLPALNTEHYQSIRDQAINIDYLLTGSQVQKNGNQLKMTKFDQKSLYELRNEHRQQMNDIMELNNRIVNNLNAKIQALIRKSIK